MLLRESKDPTPKMHNEAAAAMDGVAHHPFFLNENATSVNGIDANSLEITTAEGYVRLYLTIFSQVLAVYYGIAVFMHFVLPALVPVVSVQGTKSQSNEDTKRDAFRSFLPLSIKAATLLIGETLHRAGWGVMQDISLQEKISTPAGIASMLACVLLLDIYHDTWFYFSHRLLHRPWFMKNVHWMHHQSTVPSAFTGYSFHW